MNTLYELLSTSESFAAIVTAFDEKMEGPRWGSYLTPSLSGTLNWNAVISQMSYSPAASFIDYSGAKPLRSTPGASGLAGKIPSMGNTYTLSAEDQEEISVIEANIGKHGIDATALIDQLYPIIQRLAVGCDKSVDMLLFEALSDGTMTVDAANNPQGTSFALDWGIQKDTVAVTWDQPAATPITEIRAIVKKYGDLGYVFDRMMMDRATYDNMINTDEAKTVLHPSGLAVSNALIPESQVDSVFRAAGLPGIEIVEYTVPIEADNPANNSVIKPFVTNRVSFVPAGSLGQLKYTIDIEEKQPDPKVVYAKRGYTLLSTMIERANRSFDSKLNAFPILNSYKRIVILQTDVVTP